MIPRVQLGLQARVLVIWNPVVGLGRATWQARESEETLGCSLSLPISLFFQLLGTKPRWSHPDPTHTHGIPQQRALTLPRINGVHAPSLIFKLVRELLYVGK